MNARYEMLKNSRTANQYLISKLESFDGKMINKLSESNRDIIKKAYDRVLAIAGDTGVTRMLPTPATTDNKKVSLDGNREALENAENTIHAVDRIESSLEYEKYINALEEYKRAKKALEEDCGHKAISLISLYIE